MYQIPKRLGIYSRRCLRLILFEGERAMKNNGVPKHFAGWICEKYLIAWVVNPMRRDKRTGVIKYEKGR
jgi:hypothetical protein